MFTLPSSSLRLRSSLRSCGVLWRYSSGILISVPFTTQVDHRIFTFNPLKMTILTAPSMLSRIALPMLLSSLLRSSIGSYSPTHHAASPSMSRHHPLYLNFILSEENAFLFKHYFLTPFVLYDTGVRTSEILYLPPGTISSQHPSS